MESGRQPAVVAPRSPGSVVSGHSSIARQILEACSGLNTGAGHSLARPEVSSSGGSAALESASRSDRTGLVFMRISRDTGIPYANPEWSQHFDLKSPRGTGRETPQIPPRRRSLRRGSAFTKGLLGSRDPMQAGSFLRGGHWQSCGTNSRPRHRSLTLGHQKKLFLHSQLFPRASRSTRFFPSTYAPRHGVYVYRYP